MSDLVPREDAINREDAREELVLMLRDCFNVTDEVIDAVITTINELPFIERKTGKWLPDNNNYYDERYICSECGRNYKVDMCMGKPMWEYCPNCGARMEGEG